MKNLGLVLCYFFMLISKSILAQEYDIKFNIQTNNSDSDQFNVYILNPSDSSFIKGDVYKSGEIILKKISISPVLININSLFYSEKFILVERNNQTSLIDIGNITLIPNELDEVLIKGNTPLFNFEGDKTVINGENTSFSNSGNAEDILKKSAKVSIDNNNNVNVFGKGTAKIFVNNRLITDYEEVKSLNSNEIYKIEINTNPSAKYDADAKAVINIITKSNKSEGIRGYYSNYFTKAEFFRYYSNLKLTYRKKNIEISGNYVINPYRIYYKDEYLRNFSYDTINILMKNTLIKERGYNLPHSYAANFIYNFNKAGELAFGYSGYKYRGFEETSNINNVLSNENDYLINTSTISDFTTKRNLLTFNYKIKTDTSGSILQISYDYSNFFHKKTDSIVEEITEDISNFATRKLNNLNTNLYFNSGVIDFTKKLPNLNSSFNIGSKYVHISSKSFNTFSKYDNDNWIENPDFSQNFEYNEKLFAAYALISFSKGKFNSDLGFRYEYNYLKSLVNSVDNQFNKEFQGLFPSISLIYNWNKNWKTSLSYSKKVSRPSYQNLQPFTIYIDSLSYYLGNPQLEPEYPNSYDFSLSYKNFASLNLSYIKTQDPIYMYIITDEEQTGITYVTSKNLELSEKFNVGLTIPYETKIWTIYNSIGYSYNKIKYQASEGEDIISNDKPLFYAFSYNKFNLFKDINLYFTYQYNSSGIDGIFEFQQKHILSAGIFKSFFKEKLKLQFIYNDIFKTDVLHSSTSLNNLKINYDSYYDASYFRLIITYTFGKKFEEKTVKSGIDNELKRIKSEI